MCQFEISCGSSENHDQYRRTEHCEAALAGNPCASFSVTKHGYESHGKRYIESMENLMQISCATCSEHCWSILRYIKAHYENSPVLNYLHKNTCKDGVTRTFINLNWCFDTVPLMFKAVSKEKVECDRDLIFFGERPMTSSEIFARWNAGTLHLPNGEVGELVPQDVAAKCWKVILNDPYWTTDPKIGGGYSSTEDEDQVNDRGGVTEDEAYASEDVNDDEAYESEDENDDEDSEPEDVDGQNSGVPLYGY